MTKRGDLVKLKHDPDDEIGLVLCGPITMTTWNDRAYQVVDVAFFTVRGIEILRTGAKGCITIASRQS